MILQYSHNTPTLPLIDTSIEADQFKELCRVWNETTSTSPSGNHLGHDKCPIKYENNQETPTLATRIFKIKSQLINMALKHGIIYSRWQTINTVMIEKVHGQYHIDKLRVLHIFESDLNGTIGIFWSRRLMAQAERYESLNDAQHGSRKGRGTDTLLLTKHRTYALW